MTKTSKRQFEMSSWPTIQTAAVSLKLGRSQSSSTMHYIISIKTAESSPKKSYNSCRKETATTTASFLKPNYWHFSESYWKSMFRSDRIEPPHRDLSLFNQSSPSQLIQSQLSIIMMKYTNGQSSQQSSFLLNSQPNQDTRVNPQCPLQKPLLSYLFEESHQIISAQQPPLEVLPPLSQNQQPPTIEPIYQQKISKGKRRSTIQRVKTDLNQDGGWIETVDELKSENKILRQRLLEYEKKIVGLESVQMEAEYLAKLSLLQQSEIEKLRRMLRQANYHQIDRPNRRKSQHYQQSEGNRNLVDGESVKVMLSKNKQNCTRNSFQQKCPKKRGSFTRDPSSHNKTISDWSTADNSSASHCKQAAKKNCSRPIQQKELFRY